MALIELKDLEGHLWHAAGWEKVRNTSKNIGEAIQCALRVIEALWGIFCLAVNSNTHSDFLVIFSSSKSSN
jgi:hypothetical protein